jgi:hypothetical protein
MDKNNTINILQSFSEIYGFEYDKNPLPYIPFGGIKGALNYGTFTLYISRSESRAQSRYHTNFTLKCPNLVPKGFCIEYDGNPNTKGNGFNSRVQNRSLGNQIDILTSVQKQDLVLAFDEIDTLDEETFNIRSSLRISDAGIALSVSILFQSVDELDFIYGKVVEILIKIKAVLSKRTASNLSLNADG